MVYILDEAVILRERRAQLLQEIALAADEVGQIDIKLQRSRDVPPEAAQETPSPMPYFP